MNIGFFLPKDVRVRITGMAKLRRVSIATLVMTALDAYEREQRLIRTRQESAPPLPAGHVAGTVKWWSDEKRFGFLTPDNGQKDLFVHYTALQNAQYLDEGQRVSFRIVQGTKDALAKDVAVIGLGAAPHDLGAA